MKLELLYLKGKSSAWADEAAAQYENKISQYVPFQRRSIKSKSADRNSQNDKLRSEGQALLSYIEKSDRVILFDEGGKSFKNSIDFSQAILKVIESGAKRSVFVIGGPYGFAEEIKQRADHVWSLSCLTMNHHVAHIVALEQIYRAMTIWKGIPYHNE